MGSADAEVVAVVIAGCCCCWPNVVWRVRSGSESCDEKEDDDSDEDCKEEKSVSREGVKGVVARKGEEGIEWL